jgi:hypothetical protein
MISLVEEGEESSGVVEGSAWFWVERKVGREPRKAVSQRDRLGETSKSLEANEAIWRRRDCARGRGGRRERRVAEVVVVVLMADERLEEVWSCGC